MKIRKSILGAKSPGPPEDSQASISKAARDAGRLFLRPTELRALEAKPLGILPRSAFKPYAETPEQPANAHNALQSRIADMSANLTPDQAFRYRPIPRVLGKVRSINEASMTYPIER